MSERTLAEVEVYGQAHDATTPTGQALPSRRGQLLALLNTQEGQRQALLLADILASPLAIRHRRAVRPFFERRRL